MTAAEIEAEERRAELLAKSIGGALAAILGLKAAKPPVAWDAAKGVFTVEGRTVSAETVRRELQRIETAVGVKMSNVTDRLKRGELTLEQWRDEFKWLIGSSHVLIAALAAGSIAAAVTNTKVQSRIDSERKFADGFARDVRKKRLPASTIKARASSYLLSAAVTYAVVQHVVRKALGYTEARRVLRARESCPDCRSFGFEWMPIDKMPPIGSLQCGSRCRCYLEYR